MRSLLPAFEEDVDPASFYCADDRTLPADRPWVFANMVSTTDGAGTFNGVTGPISSPTDKALFSLLRSLADVILVGAGTVRAEGYGPARTPQRYQDQRTARGQQPFPTIAVVTASLQLDWLSPFFTEARARPLVVTMESSDPGARERASEVADVVVTGTDAVDMTLALQQLRRLGHSCVLTEGGPMLLGELVRADLLDELCLTISPLIAAGDGPRIVDAPSLAEPAPLRLAHVLEERGDLFLRYLRA
jgi:riboflavin biosynthesis pyrimidine reductase